MKLRAGTRGDRGRRVAVSGRPTSAVRYTGLHRALVMQVIKWIP